MISKSIAVGLFFEAIVFMFFGIFMSMEPEIMFFAIMANIWAAAVFILHEIER